MTDDGAERKATARRGRPTDTAEPSPAASERASEAIRAAGRTQNWVADRLGVSDRTLRRWLDGGPESRGPTRSSAEALAQLLEDPELVNLWWPPSAAPGDDGATNHRRTLTIFGGVAAALIILAVVVGFVVGRKNNDDPITSRTASPTPSAASCGRPAADPSAAPGVVIGKVCGEYAGNRAPAKTIGLWTKPGMSTGCELDACPSGTAQAGRVTVGQTIAVSCVVADGQKLRNGPPGESDYYEDQKWVRLAPGQQVAQSRDGDLYLSNIWFLRDALPSLPAC